MDRVKNICIIMDRVKNICIMKNRLLALMALCTATAFHALWAVNDPELTFVEPELEALQEKPGSSEIYYIYHVGTGKFMAAGADYGTRCVVADNGLPVTVSYGNDYELSTHATTAEDYSDAMSFRLSMMDAPSNTGFHELFTEDGTYVWTDHGKQGHILWDIVKQDNGNYRIRVNAEDPVFGMDTLKNDNIYMAVNSDDEQAKVDLVDINMMGYESYSNEWKFVDEDIYEIYAAKRNILKPQLEEAESMGVDASAETAVYDSDDATVAEINEAAAALAEKCLQAAYSSASPENPSDVTNLMANPSFDSNADGWTSERSMIAGNWGWQSNVQSSEGEKTFTGYFEQWIGTGGILGFWTVYQDVEDLPNGHYRLSADILSNVLEGAAQGLYVYAVDFGAEYKTEATHTTPSGDSQKAYGKTYSVEFDVVDHKARLGFKCDGYNSNWCGVDNFKLEYLGASPAKTLRDALAVGVQNGRLYMDTGGKCSQVSRNCYEEILSAAEAAITDTTIPDDSLAVLANLIIDWRDILKNEAADYNELLNYINAQAELLENGYYGSLLVGTAFDQFMSELLDAYDNGTFDTKDLDALSARVDSIYRSSVIGLLKSGLTNDVTGLLNNPDFIDNDLTGWSGNGPTKASNGAAELFDRSFDCYQEFTGLPSGTYEMKLQGFYRPANNEVCGPVWGVEGDHTNDVLAYAYLNEGASPLKHCYDCLSDTAIESADYVVANADSSVIKYAVNSLSAAGIVMSRGGFPVSVKGYVGNDGVLRVGIRLGDEGRLKNCWAAFGYFDIRYLGADDLSGAGTSLEGLIQDATDMLARTDTTTVDALTALTAAIEIGNAALGNLTQENYTSSTKALNEALTDGQEAIDIVAAMLGKAKKHDSGLTGTGEGSYEAYQGYPGYEELYNLVSEIMNDCADGTIENLAQVEEYSVELDRLYSKMLSGVTDLSGASLENGKDATSFIVNPDFEVMSGGELVASADGWTATAGAATAALNYEIFNDSNDVHQKLYNMPAGYYRLLWNGFYRAGDPQPAAETRLAALRKGEDEVINAEVFVDCGENHWGEPLQSIFADVRSIKIDNTDLVLSDSLFPDLPNQIYHVIVNRVQGAKIAFEDGKYESSLAFYVGEGEEPVIGMRKTGFIVNDWSCIDNFRLIYYGDTDANKPDDFVSSVEDVTSATAAEVVVTEWYTINGVRMEEPKQRGIYIRRDVMADGTQKIEKVLIK